MITDRSHPRSAMAALFVGVIALTMLLFRVIAHADPVIAPAVADPAPGYPWQTWLTLVLVAVCGIETLLRAARAGLTWLAPRTKSQTDDTLRDFVAGLDDDALAVLRVLVGVVPANPTQPATVVNVTPGGPTDPPPPPRGFGVSGVGVVLAIVSATAVLQPACATGTVTAVGVHAAAGVKVGLDCEQPNLIAAALDGLSLATQAILSTISGSGHPDATAFRAALGGIKSAGLRCAVSGAIAALLDPPPPRPDAPAAAELEINAAELRAAFAAVRDGWDVAEVHVAGQVLR